MASSNILGNERSVASADEQADTDTQAQTCPDCESRLVADDRETFCANCGLVVRRDELARTVSPSLHGPTRRSGPQEWAVEPTTAFRVNNGLGSRMNLGADGRGNPLSAERRQRFGRLRKQHQRMTSRDRRLNEALRDIETITGNLALPQYVGEAATRYMRLAAEACLPGGRMAWESLAAGAVVLAVRAAGLPHEPRDIAEYAKTTLERTCAAARKIRVQCDLVEQLPPVRAHVVDEVLAALGDALEPAVRLQVLRVSDGLMQLADQEPIGPGTTRATIAGSAVYAAMRLLDERAATQQAVTEATETVVATSRSRIKRYSRELRDAYEAAYGTADPRRVFRASRTGSLVE